MNNLNNWLPWLAVIVLYILQAVSSFYNYAKKNDPELADKLKHVGTLADWAVANQGRFTDKAGNVKFEDAVKDLTKQGIAKETAEGAVQYAYDNSKVNTPAKEENTTEIENIQSDVKPIVTPKVEAPIETGVQPVEDDNAILDNLEVK